MTTSRDRALGRPSVTDHATIVRAAFTLFQEQGFDETAMDQIAMALGVGKHTLFRYLPSKNDIPWGRFDESLGHFRQQFEAVPPGTTVADAVHACVVTFNSFDESVLAQHRLRMRLILKSPALQAHSTLKYSAWRRAIAEYVAARLELDVDDRLPRLVGYTGLAVSVAAYEQWLDEPNSSLTHILDHNLADLRAYLT